MKKNLLLLVLLMFVLMTTSVFAESSSGKLELIKGTVIYQMPGQTKWDSLTQRSTDLAVGAIIQTKENSQALLSFEDGCKILIGEMTLFKIQSKEEKDKKTLFTIKLFGKTFVEVKKSGAQNNFKIQTPTALATIRGSKVLVSVGDNLITNVTSAEGTIEVASTCLYKGTVLYVEDNLITLETAEGIKKISISSETIIPERNGSTKLKPNDRIAVYGLDAEEKTSSLFTGSELASLTVLPLKNNTVAAATGGGINAAFIAYINQPNFLTSVQKLLWTNLSPVYVAIRPTFIILLSMGYNAVVGPGQPPISQQVPFNILPSDLSLTKPKSAPGLPSGNPPPASPPGGPGTPPPPVMGAPGNSLTPTGDVRFILR